MKFKMKIIASMILMEQIYPASAALMRDDISVQVYRDFGENRGIFSPGATNVPIYKIDGSLSGYINNVPDFSSSSDWGYGTLISSQVAPTATHVGLLPTLTFAKRYQQLDATLFSGADNADNYYLMNEGTKSAYTINAGTDYMLTRMRTIVTDVAPTELFTDLEQLKYGLLIARVGGGTLGVATGPGTYTTLGYGPQAGGLNTVRTISFDGRVYTIKINLFADPLTALDVGSLGGDSGSGVWAWDTTSQSWKFLGVTSAGSGTGYGANTYFRSAPEWTQATIDSFNDPTINTLNASDVIYIGEQDKYTGEGDFTLNGETIRYHGIRTDIAASGLVDADFKSNKSLIFGGAGGTLQLTAANLDLGAGSLTFNSDYTLSDGGDSSRRMNTAGYIINAGATVLSNLTGSLGDIWRKIGLGTLVIGGSGVNHANLYVGDGLTILQRIGGHAAEALHISSGRATVRLGAANQLDGTQVGFGTRGGVLDLYGQSLNWSDIIHMDNGAIIANSNANTLSTFTFTGSGPKTYLGNFVDGGSLQAGLLHLIYAPTERGSSWTLKGNVNTRGGMDIDYGNLAVQGALTLHAGGYIDPTQYERATFDLGDSLVKLTGSQFTVGRNAMARGAFILDDASSLVMTSGGELSSSEQGINEGAYLDGSVNLTGVNSTLRVTPEAAFRIQIDAALSGAGRIIKEGFGTLYLTGINNLTGNSIISTGRVIVDSLASLGSTTNGWTINESGVLDAGNNASSLAAVLDTISDASRGVLALSGAITTADMMALLKNDLYLGSSSLLTLGVSGQNLTNGAQDLYLGGGGGEVSIKGYLPASGSSLFLGNGYSSGTVRIESSNENWVGNVDLRRGIHLIADNENALGNGRLDVNYGATAGYKLTKNITAQSAGMMSINSLDNFGYDMSAYQQLALGALAGDTLTLINTLKPTQSGYYFSGGGNVLINSVLVKGNNLMVDAQDNVGGVITLNRVNDLNSQVTVRGYNSDNTASAKSDMTLKLGIDNAIDNNSRLILEDGGVIDLNGHQIALNIESGSANSKITSSDEINASTVDLQVGKDKNVTLNSQISGTNMHLIKSGTGSLTVGGLSNFSGDVLLSAGKILAGSNSAFGAAANIVTVAANTILDVNGYSVSNTLNLASGLLQNSKAGAITLGTISLAADSTATFNGTTDMTAVGKYQLNGNRLTVNNMNTQFADNSFDDGDIVFNQSKISWGGRNNLLSSNGSLTVGNGTVLELRDVKQTEGQNKTLVLDGGTIASGTNGNGGGAGATLRSDLRVDTSGTLLGNNWAFGINLGLYGAISGSGTLNITGGQGVTLLGDTSAFTGKLLLKTNSKLNLSPAQDTTLAANMAQEGSGKAFKTGAKTLTLTGDNHLYTNELEVKDGKLVLGSSTAATGGDIRMTFGTLMLNNDSKVSLSNLASGTTVDLHGHSGILNIKANVAGSTITSSDANNWSSLNLLATTSSTLNSTISGEKIHFNKQGTGDLTLAASNTFTGDALLSGGKTILGNSQALGNAGNSVTVAQNATLDLNGNALINSLIFDGGTLVSSNTTLNTQINGPLNVASQGTLLGNTSGMDIYGQLSGSGTLNIAGGQGASLYGDTSAFHGSLWVKDNSQLHLASTKDTTLAANLVSGTGSKIVKQGDASVTLNGDNHLWESLLELNQGDLIVSQAKSAPAGEIAINGGRLVFAANEDMTPDTLLSGTAGQMVKRGSGKLTLNKENTFNQGTLVEDGILEIGDALHDTASLAGDVQVDSEGILQGYGAIGGSLFNNGVVRPAGAGRNLRVSGNYTQSMDSLLLIDLDPFEGASQLAISGSAALAGGVQTIYAPGTYTPQSYVFLTALGGVNGEFASVSDSSIEGLDQSLTYSGHDVSLTTSAVKVDPVDPVDPVTPVDPTDPVTPVDPTDPVTPVDPTDPVTPVDPTDPVTPVDPTDPVTPVDPTDPVTPVDPTDPVTPIEPVNPQPTFVVAPSNLHAYDVQLLSIGLQKPTNWSMSQVDWASSGQSACNLSEACYHDDAMWIMPHMSNGNLSANDGSAKVNGISIGGYMEEGDVRYGASVDYSDFDLSGEGSSASANRYAVNLFASQKQDSMVLTGSLGYTHAPTEVTRQVSSNGFQLGEGKSDITGNAISAGLSANWSLHVGGTTVVPQIGLDSLNVFYSDYDEHMSANGELFGSVINNMKVHGDANRYDSLQPNVGITISHGLAFGNTEVTPALKVTYRRELMNNNDGIAASNDGTLFTVESDTLGRDIIEYEAGINVKFTPHLSTSISYTGSNQQGYQSQEGAIRVKYQF